jgi:hypothetical protein
MDTTVGRQGGRPEGQILRLRLVLVSGSKTGGSERLWRGAEVLWNQVATDFWQASGSNSVVECQLPKLDVAGSNPVSRSIFSISCKHPDNGWLQLAPFTLR